MEIKALTFGGMCAKRPIVQGGMGVGVSLSSLAGAVAKHGGVGTISGVHPGYREADFKENPFRANLRAIGRELEKAKEISENGIIGFNFMTVMNHYEEYVKEAVAAGADFIVSGAGLPVNLAKYAADTSILPIVSSARALRLIVKHWQKADRLPDAVVVEGPLAGGHLGFKYSDMLGGTFASLEECLADVREYVRELEERNGVSIPVIAGGGVRSHADVERLMKLGASGVQVGTKFVATEECDAAMPFKQAYLHSKKEDVRLIESPVGLAARAIQNPFLEKVDQMGRIPVRKCYQCMGHCKQAETKYCISQALIDAVQGREGLVFCGAKAYEIEALSTVEEVMLELCGESEER